MARLDVALKSFEQSLDALETAAHPLVQLRALAEKDAAELARLSQERERLLARITELEDELRALSGLTEEVEGRLDGAILEIRTALGR
jgi:cell division protein FtsB